MLVAAKDLLPGDVFDIEPLWTADYDYDLYAFASTEYAVVEVAVGQIVHGVSDGKAYIYLSNGPANAVCPEDMQFEVIQRNGKAAWNK